MGKVSRGPNNLCKYSFREKTFISYYEYHQSREEESDEKSVKKYEEDGKRAGYHDMLLRRSVVLDLGLKPYKIRQQLLSSDSKQKRLGRRKKILEGIHCISDEVFVWSDEMFFSMDAVVNYPNNMLCATSPGNIPEDVRPYFKR